MRVVLAGLSVFACMLGAVIVLSELSALETLPTPVVGIGLGVVMVGLCVGALVVFNRPGANLLGIESAEEQIRKWEAQNALVATAFEAERALQVEEWEDEGSHYFIKLTNGSVLYLNGQYLYDYEEIADDAELEQPRRFPCSEFTIRRHREKGFVVDIDCRGAVLQPEIVAPPFSEPDYHAGRIPEDGDVIVDRTYEDIRAAYRARTRV